MKEENENSNEIRESILSNTSGNLLRDTNLKGIEKIIEEEEKENKKNEKTKKVNSLGTILSIGNSMIGSSIVTLPYNIYKTGIIPAVVLYVLYNLISFYTCKIYVDFGTVDTDFSLTIEKYFAKLLGKKMSKIGKTTQMFFCTFMATGGFITYFIIMSENFYPVICLILNKIGLDNIDSEDLTPDFSRFSSIYLGIILCFILFPLAIKKDIGFIVFISSFGCYFISILIGYVLYTGIYSLINTEFKFDYIKNKDNANERYLYLFGENPGLLTGTLSMGYFCHTVIIPILKSNKKQEKNIRDLFLGYVFVGSVYILCGILGYIGFSGKNFKSDFKDNWLMFFDSDNYLILVFRILNVVQLITAVPILFYIVRFQIFKFFYGNEYPSRKHVIFCGLCQLFLCLIIFYFCYNILAKLLSIFGACASLILVYTFPPIIKMMDYHLKKKKIYIDDDKNDKGEKNDENNNVGDEYLKEKISCKDILFYFVHIVLILIGVLTVVLQFVPINFFNITFR